MIICCVYIERSRFLECSNTFICIIYAWSLEKLGKFVLCEICVIERVNNHPLPEMMALYCI